MSLTRCGFMLLCLQKCWVCPGSKAGTDFSSCGWASAEARILRRILSRFLPMARSSGNLVPDRDQLVEWLGLRWLSQCRGNHGGRRGNRIGTRALPPSGRMPKPPCRACCAAALRRPRATMSEPDLRESAAFLDAHLGRPPGGGRGGEGAGGRLQGAALDCGAGVGRVAEGLLAPRFSTVDLAEPSRALLAEARRCFSQQPWARHFLEVPLHSLSPEPGSYTLIWVQWVLLYLTDDDLRSFLRRAAAALVGGGLLVVKENVLLNRSRGLADERDASITRSDARLRALFAASGLELCEARPQLEWPDSLLPVMMYALVPSLAS
mmetsp:Transcript_177808/g.570218  ORF Transcript_177808/g.570218 Transcript_177808/m.570218 type:complete len:322 (-) Transcript_177808:15-980(-)